MGFIKAGSLMHPDWMRGLGVRPHLLLTLCAVLLAVLALALTASAQTNPPASGDWTINDVTTISNQAVLIKGSVNVNGGGRLTLDNVALSVQPSNEGSNGLTVNSNGRLTMTGGSYGSANTMHVKFTVNSGATVAMEKVTVSDLWQDATKTGSPGDISWQDNIRGGMVISSGSVTVTNCTFTRNDRVAMTILTGSPVIRGCYFDKSAYFTYYDSGYYYMNRDAYGIIAIGSTPQIEGCTFNEMGDWDTAFNDWTDYYYGYTYLSLEGCGILAYGGAPSISGCTFTDIGRNPASGYYYVYVPSAGRYVYFYFYQPYMAGCVRAIDTMMLDLHDCNFTGNFQGYHYAYQATQSTYAVVVQGGRALVHDIRVITNGGGALFSSADELTFRDSIVMDFTKYGVSLMGGGSQSVYRIVLNGTADLRRQGEEQGVRVEDMSVLPNVHDLNISFVAYGLYVEQTPLCRFRDITINNTTRKVYCNYGRVDCYNVTAGPNDCELGWGQGEINLYFNLWFLVTWQNGVRIPGAVVQVFNESDGLLLAVQSAEDGTVPTLTLLQTKMTGTQGQRTTTTNDPLKTSAFANGTMSDVYEFAFQNNTYFHVVVWDRTPPSMVIYTPKPNHAQNTTSLQVRGVAFDFGSGLLGVEVSVDGQSWARADGWLTWNITLELEEGVYDLQVKGLDIGGGSSITLIKNVTVDLTRPWLRITQPKQAFIYTNSTSITIIGQAEIGSRVFINGDELVTVGGQFYTQRSFSSEGLNVYELVAADLVGNRNVTLLYVYQDITDPVLIIEHPTEDLITNERALEVSGLTDPEVKLTINGIDVPVEGGLFTLDMSLVEGMNVIQVEAVDLAQNHRSATLRVTYDTRPPKVTMAFPAQDVVVNTSNVVVAGTVDVDVQLVRVNHVQVPVRNGAFSKDFKLDEGSNLIQVDVVDRAGNAVTRTYTVTLDTEAPSLALESPADGSYSSTRNALVIGRAEVGATVTINGVPVNVSGGYLRVPVQLEETPPGGAPNVLSVVATDAVGNTATVVLRVVCDTQSPRLTIYDTPPTVRQDFFNLSGLVGDPADLRELTVNGVPVEPNVDGFFEAFVGLQLGNNTFTVRAVDMAGNTASRSVTMDRLSVRVRDEGILGLGSASWLLLLLFLGVGLAVAFGAMWALARREVRA